LGITRDVLKTVLRHAVINSVERVTSVTLLASPLHALDSEWIQRYFDYLSRGTLAEGARLRVNRSPLEMKCGSCGLEFTTNSTDPSFVHCPECGTGPCTLHSPPPVTIDSMEAY
jgi:hydrogenase nickel incorporation protein HypA/HybF